jgi:hypothetical protein
MPPSLNNMRRCSGDASPSIHQFERVRSAPTSRQNRVVASCSVHHGGALTGIDPTPPPTPLLPSSSPTTRVTRLRPPVPRSIVLASCSATRRSASSAMRLVPAGPSWQSSGAVGAVCLSRRGFFYRGLGLGFSFLTQCGFRSEFLPPSRCPGSTLVSHTPGLAFTTWACRATTSCAFALVGELGTHEHNSTVPFFSFSFYTLFYLFKCFAPEEGSSNTPVLL